MVRVINSLFSFPNPSAQPNGFLTDINPQWEIIFPNAIIETGFENIRRRAPWPAEAGEKSLGGGSDNPSAHDNGTNCPETVRSQGMRMGYFCVDKNTKEGTLVLNGIVALKEILVKAEGGIALVELLHTSISGRFYGCVLERLATSCCHTQWIALACAWLTRGSSTRVLRDLLRTICEHAILPACFEERRLRQRSLRIPWPHVW